LAANSLFVLARQFFCGPDLTFLICPTGLVEI